MKCLLNFFNVGLFFLKSNKQAKQNIIFEGVLHGCQIEISPRKQKLKLTHKILKS